MGKAAIMVMGDCDPFNDVDYIVSNAVVLGEIEKYARTDKGVLLSEQQMYGMIERGEIM